MFLITGIFLFGKTSLPVKTSTEKLIAPSSGLDFGAYIDSIIEALPNNTKNELETLQDQIKEIAGEEQSIIKIVEFWEQHRHPEIAAKYYFEAASVNDNSELWLASADLFRASFYGEENKNLSEYYISSAIRSYLNFTEIHPEDMDVKFKLATCYVDGTDKIMLGVNLLKDVVKNEPDNFGAHHYLGLLSMKSGQFEKAITRFEKVVEIVPENIDAWLFLGEAYSNLGNTAKAIEVLTKCKTLIDNQEMKDRIDQYIETLRS